MRLNSLHKTGLVAFALGLASLWACADRITTGSTIERSLGSPSTAAHATNARPTPHNPYAFVGVIHNQALNYGYQQIKHAPRADGIESLTKDDYYNIAATSLASFFEERGIGRLTAGTAQEWRGILEKHPNASARELAGVMTVDPNDGSLTDISPEAWDYLNQLLWIADYAETMTELENQVAAVEFSAGGALSGTDLEIVYATAAVTVSSASYWEVNYDHWRSLCEVDTSACVGDGPVLFGTGPGGITIQRVNGWKVLAADVVGCIASFLGGGWPGCAVGAGAASINSIIGQL